VIRVTGNVSIGGPLVVAPASALSPVIPRTGVGGSCFVPSQFEPGRGPAGLAPLQARMFLKPYRAGFGSGKAKAGGGSVFILAAGPIDIAPSGSISASGESGVLISTQNPYAPGQMLGYDAGAGGLVVLGSRTAVRNAGALTANGGNGANGNPEWPAGGGAGGGIIHLLGPSLVPGATNVSGGAGGSGGNNPSPGWVVGGACGGGGGASGLTGVPGGLGQVFTTITADPAPFLVP
jgi:hypothetical protein